MIQGGERFYVASAWAFGPVVESVKTNVILPRLHIDFTFGSVPVETSLVVEVPGKDKTDSEVLDFCSCLVVI